MFVKVIVLIYYFVDLLKYSLTKLYNVIGPNITARHSHYEHLNVLFGNFLGHAMLFLEICLDILSDPDNLCFNNVYFRSRIGH